MDIRDKINGLLNKSFDNIEEVLALEENKVLIKSTFKNIFDNSFNILSLKALKSFNLEAYIFQDEFESQYKSNNILLNFRVIKGIDFINVFESDLIKILNIDENKYYSIRDLKEALKLDFNVGNNTISYKSKASFISYED
jgi:hypothetical protein